MFDSKSNARDGRQRAFGFIGFSLLAHAGALSVLILSQSTAKDLGSKKSNSDSLIMDLKSPGARGKTVEVATTTEKADHSDHANSAVVAAHEPVLDKSNEAVSLPAHQPRKPVVQKTMPEKKAHTALAKQTEEKAKPVMLDEKSDEAFQPMSEPDSAANEREQMPENLSPMIVDRSPDEMGETQAQEMSKEAEPESQTTAATTPKPAETETETTSSTRNSQGSGPSDAPQGTGDGYGAPAGEQIVDSSLRHPLVGNRLPSYPQQDQLLGRQGTAVVIGRVNSDGTVSNVQLEKSSGSPLMDRAAADTFKTWKFAPGPVAHVRKGFAFTLSGEAKTLPAKLGSR